MPWLSRWRQEGLSPEAARAGFDSLPPVTLPEVLGDWLGEELPTGHPLDGLLARYGWKGKRLTSADSVDPLVFHRGSGDVAVNPALIPLGVPLAWPSLARSAVAQRVFRTLLPVLATHRPKARLRAVAHRGQVSTAMIYDDLPIIDHFRKVDRERLLGLMDLRHTDQPYFFLLRRRAGVL